MTPRELINALDEVLSFSSEMILLSLQGKKPKESRIKNVKHSCKLLTEANVFKFDTNSDNDILFQQIQDFASHVDG